MSYSINVPEELAEIIEELVAQKDKEKREEIYNEQERLYIYDYVDNTDAPSSIIDFQIDGFEIKI